MSTPKRRFNLLSLTFIVLNLYFAYESRDTLKSFTLFITAKTITKLNPGHSSEFENRISRISSRSSRSSDNGDFGHFTLLFCRGRQKKKMYKDL